MLLEMSKTFLNEILKAKGEVVYSKRHGKEVQSGGRRTDEARNAYWASVVSHVPRDVFRTRQGRATMRLLGGKKKPAIDELGNPRGKAKLLDQSPCGYQNMTKGSSRPRRKMGMERAKLKVAV